MGTNRTFDAMLNEVLTPKLLRDELTKRSYFLDKIAKEEDWKGGSRIVPFYGADPTSVKFGGLTAANDIAEAKLVRGRIDSYKEVWGTLVFNETDLMQHDGPKPESSYLTIIPDQIERFMTYLKEVVSYQIGVGSSFARVTGDASAASGIFTFDRIDRFILGQKVTLDDDNSMTTDAYVTNIDLNLNTVQFSLSRNGPAANLSQYTTAQNARVYYDGVWDGTTNNSFLSIRQALLSASNGGDTTLHGYVKTSYPYLQCVNVDGSDISATNIVEKLFDKYVTIRIKARGQADTFVMSFKNWGSCMKSMQIEKGAFVVTKNPTKSQYGWFEMSIASTKSGDELTIAGVQEMSDDIIFVLDWSTMKFCSNGGFRRRIGPDKNQYYVIRNTTGYQYVVDVCLFGEMQYTNPSNNGVIYNISY